MRRREQARRQISAATARGDRAARRHFVLILVVFPVFPVFLAVAPRAFNTVNRQSAAATWGSPLVSGMVAGLPLAAYVVRHARAYDTK